jgi:hypothetical protein
MLRNFLMIIVISYSLFSCGTFKELSRTYSPDKTKYLLHYYHIEVPWAAGAEKSIAILKPNQSVRKANKYSISGGYIDTIYWKGNDTVIAEEDFIEYQRQGKSYFKNSEFSLNGVSVKTILKDPIESNYTRKIIYQERSPDNKRQLIVYTYEKPGSDYYLLNVSVLNINDTIPKFGNLFISEQRCVTETRWSTENTIILKIQNSCRFIVQFYFVKNRPHVNINVEPE